MPKLDIDYSNTIIYKIVCKDESIKELYVGHTTNFVQRKSQHKQASNDIHNNCKLYQTIRTNGGWDNWSMDIVNFFNCENSYQARKKEQEYYESLNATLNSVKPFPLKKNNDEKNKIILEQPKKEDIDITEQANIFTNNQNLQIVPRFYCDKCQYKTDKKSSYESHKLSARHNKHKTNIVHSDCAQLTHKYKCNNCEKPFNDRAGLWRHKKKCSVINENATTDTDLNKNIIMMIQENKEFKELLIEQNKQINKQMIELIKNSNCITNNNNINTTNNAK
jgi:hypothetical protein